MRTLRPYQEICVQYAQKHLACVRSTLLVLPTGMGKTVIFSRLTRDWKEQGLSTLVLAHRTELIYQARDKIESELGHVPAVEMGLQKAEKDCLFSTGMVVVGSVQTMCGKKTLEKYKETPFDRVVIDEAHHATSASYRRIVDFFAEHNPRCRVFGVTATPNRADKAALGIVFDSVAHQIDVLDGMNDGWLVPIEQEFVQVQSLDFTGVRINSSGDEDGDFNSADLETVLTEEGPMQEMSLPILERTKDGQPTLIFAAGVEHARIMSSVLNRHKPGSAIAIDGKTDKIVRAKANRDFATGQLQYLCNHGTHTEGFDCPECIVVVMGRPTKSVSLYTQMLGRGMRPLDGTVDGWQSADDRRMAIRISGKPCVHVYDFVGVSEHKLASSLDVLGGNYNVAVRELAAAELRRKPGDVKDALARAKTLYLLKQEEERRNGVKANKGEWVSHKVDPFSTDGAPVSPQAVNSFRGGSSDAQIQFLCNLGVPYETAAGYSQRQAGAVITKLKATRCTTKQKELLAKFGEPVEGVNFEQASRLIDEIKAAGWQPRQKPGAT